MQVKNVHIRQTLPESRASKVSFILTLNFREVPDSVAQWFGVKSHDIQSSM
jgi:hypothetical protein